MAKKTQKTSVLVFRFSLRSAGPPRTKEQLRATVEEARKEALEKFRKSDVKAKAEPEGAFLGAGIEWVWLLHVSLPYLHAAATGLATGAGTAAGKKVFDYFAKALRKRNVLPAEPEMVTPEKKRSSDKSQTNKKDTKSRKK